MRTVCERAQPERPSREKIGQHQNGHRRRSDCMRRIAGVAAGHPGWLLGSGGWRFDPPPPATRSSVQGRRRSRVKPVERAARGGDSATARRARRRPARLPSAVSVPHRRCSSLPCGPPRPSSVRPPVISSARPAALGREAMLSSVTAIRTTAQTWPRSSLPAGEPCRPQPYRHLCRRSCLVRGSGVDPKADADSMHSVPRAQIGWSTPSAQLAGASAAARDFG